MSKKLKEITSEESCCESGCCSPSSYEKENLILDANSIKTVVKEKYAEIAESKTSCCAPDALEVDAACCVGRSYESQPGYMSDADLNLGCGIPTEYAKMKKGDTVLDLGSGGGNDVFVARNIVGETGHVIGVDMTEAMIDLAQRNKEKMGFKNIDFFLGEIERLPISGETVDVVLSNCVMNLVPNKLKAYQEVFRVLKTGGHFSISDIVLEGNLPEEIMKRAEMYVGCVSGAMDFTEYLGIIKDAGFDNIDVVKKREIKLPDSLLEKYLSPNDLKTYQTSDAAIYSVTLFGMKRN